VALAAGATACLAGGVALGGVNWLVWLALPAVAGSAFLHFDLRLDGRAGVAEEAGAAT
jgi:hypothetical protein